jgi:hypothetical protein
MKRQTREELAAECERLRTENTVLSHALTILVQKSTPNAREVVREKEGDRYVYEVHGATQPHGGILLITFHYPRQRPHVSAYYLENYARNMSIVLHEKLEHRCAVERLQVKAHALQRATYANKSA